MTDLPATMPALVYDGPNTMGFRAEPLPALRPGEVMVRVAAVGICGSDMHAWHGHDSRRPAPLILGHEAAGEIVTGPRAGERVTVNPLVVDPACPAARAGRPHLSPTRQIISMPPRNGAFAGYVAVPDGNARRIPDGLDLGRAALCEPLAVSWHAVKLGLGKLDTPVAEARVVILGGGAIGLAAALAGRAFGVGALALAETNPARRDLIAAREGVETFDPLAGDGPAEGADLIIDAVGATATRALASRAVRPGGVIVHAGLLPGDAGLDVRRITLQEITVTGTYCYTPADFDDTLAALAAGRLGALDWFETRPLAAGAAAFADIDAGRAAMPKIVLAP